MPTNPEKLEQFSKIYADALMECVASHPSEYAYSMADVPRVAYKMTAAFASGNYNKDGRAVKLTCKKLGIAHTYTAINAFLQDK